MTEFICGSTPFSAFSGEGDNVNKRTSACIPGIGPIPPGSYYIIDRETGGDIGWLRDLFSGRKNWFALYAKDAEMDDVVFCDRVKRGEFRLHPRGPSNSSKG